MKATSTAIIAYIPEGFIQSEQYYQPNYLLIINTGNFAADSVVYTNQYNYTVFICQGTLRVTNISPNNIGAREGWIGGFLIWLTD